MSSAISAALHSATIALAPISDSPRLDAELLMAHALGMERGDMLMRMRDLDAPPAFAAYITRRIAHEPVAYIIGTQAFWDLELSVTPDVLIPRGDSETLIEAASDAFLGRDAFAKRDAPLRILDLGTGSGALLLAALSVFPNASGLGVDASEPALQVARRNAITCGFNTRAGFAQLNWRIDGWHRQLDAPYDLILCNPPYIEQAAELSPMVKEHEPHSALFAGDDGLNDYRLLLPQIGILLTHYGVAIFEIGFNQAESVGRLASESGLNSILRHDLAGNPRCLTLRIG
jgi:release factor glutamine methyltransferase